MHHRLPARYTYLLILLVTLAITWNTNVDAIIAYASRAFALYYTLQCLIAAVVAWQSKALPRQMLRVVGFAIVGIACLAVFALGLPSG